MYIHADTHTDTFGWRSCEFYETRPPWLPPRSWHSGVTWWRVVIAHKTRHSHKQQSIRLGNIVYRQAGRQASRQAIYYIIVVLNNVLLGVFPDVGVFFFVLFGWVVWLVVAYSVSLDSGMPLPRVREARFESLKSDSFWVSGCRYPLRIGTALIRRDGCFRFCIFVHKGDPGCWSVHRWTSNGGTTWRWWLRVKMLAVCGVRESAEGPTLSSSSCLMTQLDTR